ncbi:centromere protein O-like [Pyrus ussuriensis x Pyrus communis]|uniref:Centromere protein O-like n=1 Tax=Pyrus ussuriensis x Pyrus communis TaxID=2448454 RepID=A0A5N5HTI9_9ROSA|nr:centromere protein O-like [Pyrus ussuriensis x Pyrus communis]
MGYSDDAEELLKRRPRKMAYLGNPSRRQLNSRGRSDILMGEMSYMQEEDISLDAIRLFLCLTGTNVLKGHSELAERLSRDANKIIYERLQKEFEDARASQTQENYLDGERWNDGLLATIRERIYCGLKLLMLEFAFVSITQITLRITYKIGNKEFGKFVTCCLEGARIGKLYEMSYAGETCDLYHCVLESMSFFEKMTVLEHTIPYFLPIREVENGLLSSNAMKLIDYIGEILQAYVGQKGTPMLLAYVRLAKELYGNQIKEIHFTLPYSLIVFSKLDFDCKVVVKLKHAQLVPVLPNHVSVVAWPVCQPGKSSPNISSMNKKENGTLEGPTTLFYAEDDALRTMSLPKVIFKTLMNFPQHYDQMILGKF